MTKRTVIITILLQMVCWSVVVWIVFGNSQQPAVAAMQVSTPSPFLGPIYYGQEDILAVFDHEYPLFRPTDDNNDDVRHYNGFLYEAVTATPTSFPYIPVSGFGYDQHVGIDYNLRYEPVLAAAEGTVTYAGWSDPTNHRALYGLYVRMEHADPSYRVWYGHLSTLNVETGDEIIIDPLDPGNRNRILGISGNTGSLQGCDESVGDDPLCSAHLHIEVRQININRPVNPYGWIGLTPLPVPSATPVVDPWSVYIAPNGTPGATSYDLWIDKPAILPGITDQYPGGTPLDEPAINNARMIIDDGSADFFPGPCWTFAGGSASYNNGYYYTPSDGKENCTARWTIRPDAFTQPGAYDVFAHIPAHANPSLSVAYDVHHNSRVSRAIAVQAAYVNNSEHDAWAYLGRYDFAMSDSVSEFILVHDHDLFHEDDGRYTLADAIMLAPANGNMPLPQRYLYVSFASSGYAGNVPYENEDILLFDAATSEWRMFFDGSDVGLAGVDIDAVDFRNGHLFFSLDAPLGSYTASDIIRFVPASLGENTSGTMSVYIPGEKLGLIPAEFPGENIDALTFNDQGKIVLSTQGQAEIGPDIFEDEDLFISDSDTSASLFFDGSDYALNEVTENVDGVWLGANGSIYLSTAGSFAVTEVSGDGADIFICAPGIFMNCWFVPGLFWNGSAHGLGNTSANIDDFFINSQDLFTHCPHFTNGGFEAGFYCWEIIYPTPSPNLWRLPTVETHSGQFSAQARAETYTHSSDAFLISSPVQVSDDQAYRFRLWAKGIPEDVSGSMQVFGRLTWYVGDDVYQSDGFANINVQTHLAWTEFDSGFICPPSASVNQVRLEFELVTQTLSQVDILGVGSIFIDDISWESQPCNPTAPQD
ncbi:MAG: peptidoglycan DD-metalloendopeptidase family protein [Ardenticatenaceae bacterium]|nr:peptidoglycan DD-metalloendopeptidase family protein [Ardenticatenaceae bacterium]MBL1129074.1 hypothetical protein [Chloroflexota bacterium]